MRTTVRGLKVEALNVVGCAHRVEAFLGRSGAHRDFWAWLNGLIPEEYARMHDADTRTLVSPENLVEFERRLSALPVLVPSPHRPLSPFFDAQ